MKRFALTICLAACLVFALGSVALAASTVDIESKNSYEGSPDAAGIFISNSVVLRSVTVPIVIRQVDTYPSDLGGEYVSFADGGRLGLVGEGPLAAINSINGYDAEDGTCKQDQPGGFGTISFGGAGLDQVSVPSPSDPDAIQFSRNRILASNNLPVGDDGFPGGTPSLRITYTCPQGGPYGDFIIDTTCANPASHLLLVDGNTNAPDPLTYGGAATITCLENSCPTATAGDVSATVGTMASNQVNAVDPEGDTPIEYFMVSGPGSVDASGLWSYTPTCGDFPGFDVTIEASDKGEGACAGGQVTFHVDVAPTALVPSCTDVTVLWGDMAAQTVTVAGGCPPYTFSGGAPGAVDGGSGEWTYATGCGDVGTVGVSVTVEDAAGQSVNCDFDLTVTNTAPTCSDPEDITVPNDGLEYAVVLGPANDADGDPITYNIASGNPSWGAIVGNEWRGTRDGGDDGVYTVCYTADDGCEVSAECCFDLLFESPYIVCFDDGDNAEQDPYVETLGGRNADICIWVDPSTGSSEGVGGFDFLICYDQSGLEFISAMRGPDLHEDWEYFTYRTGMFGGNCTGGCPDGFVRLVGITDMNNGIDPDPNAFRLAGNVICLTFWVTSDQEFTGSCLHVGFCSYDCGDNTISSKSGNTLFLPLSGAQLGPDYELEACLQPKPDHDAQQFINFCQGAICIIPPPDDRGDLNLNGIPNEIGDAVLYSNYFIYGSSVWDDTWEDVQIFASDVNNDGLTLTIADLVYLIRIITGDEQPFPDDNINPKVSPYANAVNVVTDVRNGNLTVHTNASVDLGGAVLVYRYSNLTVGEAEISAEGMVMKSRANNGELRIVMYPDAAAPGKVSAGQTELVNIPVEGDGTIELVESQFADANGAQLAVNATKVAPPTSYALHQNFPNPFNAGTVIPLDLKNGGDWSITVYNVAGQVVKTFNGTDEPGTINVRWDGRGDNGEAVASGMYFYRGVAEGFTATKKMVLLK
jgi:hypothetical protein